MCYYSPYIFALVIISTHFKHPPFGLPWCSSLSRVNSRTQSRSILKAEAMATCLREVQRRESLLSPRVTLLVQERTRSARPGNHVDPFTLQGGAWGSGQAMAEQDFQGSDPGHSGPQAQQKCRYPTLSMEEKSHVTSRALGGLTIVMSLWTRESGDERPFTPILGPPWKQESVRQITEMIHLPIR